MIDRVLIDRVLTDDRDLLDPRVVGFKFARQAELRGAGFPVPEFYCIPGAAFDAAAWVVAAKTGGFAGLSSAERDVLACAARMRAGILERGVPHKLAAHVLDQFDSLVGVGGLAAVRACAVASVDGQGEDGDGDPFAGLSDSFLYVGRADLLHRVAACWASAYTERAALYRQRRGLDPLSATIGVGVQRMVRAARSFVAFTRDPVDGSDRCVIAAAHGVGEGVVQEKADLDHFYVDLARGTVDGRVVRKARMVGHDPADPTAGTAALRVPAALADAPVLTNEEAANIAALAARVEAHFGAPQDIEGALTADGQVMIVQARPIVSPAATLTSRPRPPGDRITWANSNITESFPGVSCALTYSIGAQFGANAFTDFYRRMGVAEGALRARAHDLRRLLAYLNGRIYYRLDTWYGLHSQIPSFAALRSTWEPALGLPDAVEQAASPVRSTLSRSRMVAHYLALVARYRGHRREMRLFLDWWDDWYGRQDAPDQAQRPAGALVEEYHRLWAEVGARWGTPSVSNFYLLLVSKLTDVLTRRWLPGVAPGELTGMMCGGAENRSTAAVRSAVALAERVAEAPDLRTAVLARDERQVWADVVAGKHGQDFAAAATSHVRRYGDRGLHDLKMESVTVRQAPWTLIPILRAYVGESRTADGNRNQELQTRARAEIQLRRRCRHPVRRAILRRCYAVMRELFRLREDTRFCRSQLFGASRAMLLAIGAQLAEAGLLQDRRDVLDLTVHEVLGAYEGTLAGTDLQGLARVRRAQREAWQAEPDPPPLLRTDTGLPLAVEVARQRAPDANLSGSSTRRLAGVGSSPGRVRARAKVILDPSTDIGECRGHVLVARETDPGWLFLMMAAEGIVVERGSPVSHTAITGRMLAIPTVVAVPAATKLIKDGDLVELDGTAGTVTLLGAADAHSGTGAGEGAIA